MSHVHWLVAAFILVRGAVAAPPEITGTVVDFETGKPVARARVTVMIWTGRRTAYGEVLIALTAEDGRFRFRGLPDSECELRAEKAGYQSEVPSRRLRLGPDAFLTPLTFRLTQLGGLTVRVVDDTGSSVDGAQVSIERRGQDAMSYSVPAPGRVALTRGSYRVSAVSPGIDNVLRVRGKTFVPTFYPGTASIERAEWIDVVPGKEMEVDVPITPIPGRHISGHLGLAGALIQASIRRVGYDSYMLVWGVQQIGKAGDQFRISGLIPGLYQVDFGVCISVPCMTTTDFRKTIQVVDSDIDNLVISEADRLGRR